MNNLYASRMGNVHKSFIREILKVTNNPNIISFAGGLPNPKFFPVEELKAASCKVLEEHGAEALQYSTTEGYLPLRQYIADRYMKNAGLKVDADEILITNGSQQGLDLIGKIFLDNGDNVILESPGYLGAIQSLAMYEPEFHTVTLSDDGVEIPSLKEVLAKNKYKLFYTVPNFQNPSGISYTEKNRQEIAQVLKDYNTILIEDNPYGELRFSGSTLPSMKSYLGDQCILLGSFSKVVAPGLRLGWICACKDIMEKLVVAKQAADLHSNYFSQRVVHQFLVDNELDEHLLKIKEVYKRQRDCMVDMIQKYFPKEIKYTQPEGGMFLWITLPEGCSSLEMFDYAIKEGVAFVPGMPFYVDGKGANTLRLNYSNSDEAKIEEGMKRLARVLQKFLNN